MRRQAYVVLTTLSLFAMLTATSVSAQSNLHLAGNIPFEFSVGNKILPAGEYTIRYQVPHVLLIQSVDRHEAQFFSTLGTGASTTRYESSLVFNKYGDQYFLSTIWTSGAEGYELFKSRAEEELIRTRRALANSAWERQTVSIVAHR